MKAMARNQGTGPIQLSFAKEKGEDGDEQVQLGHSQYFQGIPRKAVDQLNEQGAGVILISNRIIDRGEVNRVMPDSRRNPKNLGKGLLKREKGRFFELTNRNDIYKGHE